MDLSEIHKGGFMSKKNSWICEEEKVVISSPVLDIIEQNCRSSEDERKHKFYLLKSRNWCNIIPITEDGNVVFVKQYRIGIGEHTLEVPGGVVDPTDSNCLNAAIREMQEETGYAPLPGAQCISLGWTFPNPAILNNQCFSYVVGPVKKVSQQKLDPGEMIEIIEVPLAEVPQRIIQGEITHALMLNAFFFLTLQSEKGASGLIQELSKWTRPQD
jgi:8-oxo-dGTP pyrophosphatase MutT (NUDIX family)